jgi:hypothetical protein
MSLFDVNAENAKVWSKAYAEFFQEKLGVPPDRGLMYDCLNLARRLHGMMLVPGLALISEQYRGCIFELM